MEERHLLTSSSPISKSNPVDFHAYLVSSTAVCGWINASFPPESTAFLVIVISPFSVMTVQPDGDEFRKTLSPPLYHPLALNARLSALCRASIFLAFGRRLEFPACVVCPSFTAARCLSVRLEYPPGPVCSVAWSAEAKCHEATPL